VLHALSMTPLDDHWYMGNRATSYLTANGGLFLSYSNMNNNILGDSGHHISVIGYGNALVPNPRHSLTLNNVLHTPKLIENLVSV